MGKHIAPLLGKHAECGTTSRNPNVHTNTEDQGTAKGMRSPSCNEGSRVCKAQQPLKFKNSIPLTVS